MTAISKTWVAIADTAVDPDSPLDAALMTGLRDDLIHLREWLGASYTAGAVQDHNHDGTNSAAISIGPNWLRNGGFESGTAGWTLTEYTGGTVGSGTSNETEGTTGLFITSTNATNGGGNAVSNEFIPITGGQTRQFLMTIKSSLANCPLKAEVLWFDDAQAQISASTIISTTTAGPTTDRLVVRRIAAPATAKFCKVKCELPAGGAATGSVYFDAIVVTTPALIGFEQVFTSSGTYSGPWGDVYAEVQGGGGEGSQGTTFSGVNGGTSSFSSISATGGVGGTNGGVPGAGGTGAGGVININGQAAANDTISGGDSFLGFGGILGNLNAKGLGGGGGGAFSSVSGVGGGAGGYAEGPITISADVSVVVGAGGAGGGQGGDGTNGIVRVRA